MKKYIISFILMVAPCFGNDNHHERVERLPTAKTSLMVFTSFMAYHPIETLRKHMDVQHHYDLKNQSLQNFGKANSAFHEIKNLVMNQTHQTYFMKTLKEVARRHFIYLGAMSSIYSGKDEKWDLTALIKSISLVPLFQFAHETIEHAFPYSLQKKLPSPTEKFNFKLVSKENIEKIVGPLRNSVLLSVTVLYGAQSDNKVTAAFLYGLSDTFLFNRNALYSAAYKAVLVSQKSALAVFLMYTANLFSSYRT